MKVQEFVDKYGLTPHNDILRGDFIAQACLQECSKHPPIVNEYGIETCKECQKEAENSKPMGAYPEFTTDAIRRGREEYAADMIQSHRQGELSREFVEAYPERVKGMVREGLITKKEVKKAKNVWKGDIHRSWERNKKIDADYI